MPTLVYGTTSINYTIDYQKNKTDISIVVEWLDGVSVTAPIGISEETLNLALRKKAPWILKKWNEFSEIHGNIPTKEFISGEKFSYLGRHYRLKVIKQIDTTTASLSYAQGKFLAKVPATFSNTEIQEELRKLFKAWYIKNGEKKVRERVERYASKMLVEPSSITLKEQKMRWGTCTSSNAILLNWRLVMAPVAVLDYVLVHELAHIKHSNHDKDFWRFIESVMPDYKERKEWLRVNGPLLTL